MQVAMIRPSGRRAAVAIAAIASAAHLALSRHDLTAPGPTWTLLGAFWIACAAMLAVHQAHLRRHDALAALCDVDDTTGCLTRRGFTARLDAAMAEAIGTGAPVALIALDLDHFKRVNDRFGHLSGDAVLSAIGSALRRVAGTQGSVARLGGEEFAVLLRATDAEDAGVAAERVLAALRGLVFDGLPGLRLTMSAGIAVERVHHAGMAGALRARADEALYAAKRSGRDRALLWAPGVRSHATPACGHTRVPPALPVVLADAGARALA
jgi:diguanylate cyclase (GGDEF)-like protein